ncbi:hypothetical protein J7K44_03070 [bacterium]|nr:hypothetical protein [bacterium]
MSPRKKIEKKQKGLDGIYGPIRKDKFLNPHKKKRATKTWAIIAFFSFLILVFVATLAGFLIFGPKNEPKWESEKIVLEISGDKEIRAGEEINYKILIANQGNVDLTKGEVSISFPQGFSFISSQPKSSSQLTSGAVWKLTEIYAHSSREIKFKGKIFGNINEKKMFIAALNYQPANFSSNFLETTSLETTITSSILDISLETPSGIIQGQEFPLELNLKNNSSQTLENLKLVFEGPDSFELTSLSNISLEKNILTLPKVKSQKEKQIEIEGKISEFSGEKVKIKVEAGILDSSTGEMNMLASAEQELSINKVNLEVLLKINNSQENQKVNIGDTLNYEINVKNKGKQELKDLALKISFSEVSLIDWDSLEISENISEIGETERDGQLFFNKFQLNKLEKLEPQGDISIQFKIGLFNREKLADILEALQKEGKIQLKSQVTCLASINGIEGSEFETESNQIVLEVE